MNTSRRGLFAVAALAWLIAGCDKKPASPPAPPSQTAPSASQAMDWSKIAAVNTGEEIAMYKTLARKCDGWFKGAMRDITLRFENGAVTDGAGHSVPIAPGVWKGIVENARKTPGTVAMASKSSMYAKADDFGTLPRYKYQMTIVDDATLTFHNAGMQDDGK